MELDIHFVREKVAIDEVKVLHVPTSLQYADIFTKGLPTTLFEQFRSSLTILPYDASTAGGWKNIREYFSFSSIYLVNISTV